MQGTMQFSVERATPASRIGLPLAIGFLVVAATLPWWGDSNWMREFNQIACYFIFASMWNLLAGYGGMVSIGQQAYLGFGGYMLVVLANMAGINPFAAVPIAAFLTALIALPVSRVAFRLHGGYFAIGTWVIAEVFRLSFSNLSAVGGGSGTSLTAVQEFSKATRESFTYWMTLAGAAGTIGLTYWYLRSKQGLALLAIRDTETASESQGVNVAATKLGVYIAASFGAGLAGALYFLGTLRISPDAAFSVNWTAFSIFMVMIGGLGTIEGPIIGAVIFWALNKFLSDYGTWYLVGLGGLAILMTLLLRKGLWGLIRDRSGMRFFPVERRLVENSERGPRVTAGIAPGDNDLSVLGVGERKEQL